MTNRALIVAIVVLGIGLAGCGSSKTTSSSSTAATTSSSTAAGGTAAFKAAFVADRTQFRQLGNSLAKALTGAGSKTDDQLATQFQGLAVKAKAEATKLSQLSPPAQFKPTLDKLVTALNNVGDKLQKIATDATNHNATTAKTDTITLVQQAAAVKAADTTLSSGLKLPAGA